VLESCNRLPGNVRSKLNPSLYRLMSRSMWGSVREKGHVAAGLLAALSGAVWTEGNPVLVCSGPLTLVEEINFARYAARRGNSGLVVLGACPQGNPLVGRRPRATGIGDPPKLLVKTLIKGILTTRLETRTKECYVCASIVVKNHSMRNESKGKH